jgi:cytochrome c5
MAACHPSRSLIPFTEVAVKKISLLLAVLGLSVAGSAIAAQSADADSALIKRITPVGSVCVEGKACDGVVQPTAPVAATAATPAAAAGGARSGEQVFNAYCHVCHAAGLMGAPKVGDKASWAPHIAKGKSTLYSHAMSGFNAMPVKGTCADCTEAEIKAAVDYMTGKSE